MRARRGPCFTTDVIEHSSKKNARRIHLAARVTETFNPNPYSPPTATPDRPLRLVATKRSLSLRRLCIFQCGIIVVALAAEVYDIETIMGSGPIFGIVGIGIMLVAYRERDFRAAAFGASAPMFATFIFSLIVVMDWGPAEADQPVQWLSFGFALLAVPAAGWMVLRRPDERYENLDEHHENSDEPWNVSEPPPVASPDSDQTESRTRQ